MAIERRSEFVYLMDAENTNPNGDPMDENRPRRDDETNRGVITDVRLKRYIRDEMQRVDGDNVYIGKPSEGKYIDRVMNIQRSLDIESPEDLEEIDDPMRHLKKNVKDVRMFGALLSLSSDGDDDLREKVVSAFDTSLTGPIQISPGVSLHPVVYNSESNSLTSVISTGGERESGSFDVEDHRIKYGMYRFHGIVDARTAETTLLSEEDVTDFDSLIWRGVENQTATRSKFGQSPRLYLRVEFNSKDYYHGDLHHGLGFDEDLSDDPQTELRSVDGIVVDATRLMEMLDNQEHRISSVHVNTDSLLTLSIEDNTLDGTEFVNRLEDMEFHVNRVDPYNDQ